jgi:hypothetical protein
MKYNLTKQSDFLVSLFEGEKKERNGWDIQTQQIFKGLYNEVIEANDYFNFAINYSKSSPFYEYKIFSILNKERIPKPQDPRIFEGIPYKIKDCIEKYSHFCVFYTFSLFERSINLYFIVEKIDNIRNYHDYVKRIYMWLFVLTKHSKYGCTQHLEIFMYLTAMCKEIPNNPENNDNTNEVIGQYHVNTAFTFSCKPKNEIIIFRKEEWFKVFIHESFHSFGLDFSDMNSHNIHKQQMLEIFPVNSEVNLFEAYTEFWAEILNCIFSSYFILSNKKIDKHSSDKFPMFLKMCKYFIETERNFGFFQLEKVLNYMGLDYKTLIDKNSNRVKTLYKEDSNVLSYYIIRVVLLNEYPKFINWCKKYNMDLLQFKKTEENIDEFCNFIKRNYMNKELLDNLEYNKNILFEIKKKHAKRSEKRVATRSRARANARTRNNRPNTVNNLDYVLKNIRMSSVEIA